jgi:hypothetical protein
MCYKSKGKVLGFHFSQANGAVEVRPLQNAPSKLESKWHFKDTQVLEAECFGRGSREIMFVIE